MLHDELAPRILPVILANVTTRYPYHDAHLMREGDVPRDPTNVHAAFGNSFDWHSSVHSHWTALQLLAHLADDDAHAVPTRALQAAVTANLHAENLAAEAAYLTARPGYERPYGWAWTLLLAAGAHAARDEAIRACAEPLRALADVIEKHATAWLRILPEPIRHGVHSNTAFALGLMLDAAPALAFDGLTSTIAERAMHWFGDDRAWPGDWERSGNDFLSPGLAEADLMRRVLAPSAFAAWWERFLPGVTAHTRMLSVVAVPDVIDGHIVHLHGLNLSRAGMLSRIAARLNRTDLLEQAQVLYRASVDRAVDGDYLATHWLATFAWDAGVSIDRARTGLPC